jgi:transcriptional regulator with XRE-family HTH domain
MPSVKDRPAPATLARLDTGALIREARTLAGLTQTQLAARVRTKQSVISRWERGVEEPRLETLARLLRACGFEADVTYRRHDDIDRSQLSLHLAMAPAERARHHRSAAQAIARARAAARAA